jgi:hypothetical protein
MSKVMKGTFLAVACLIGTATFIAPSQAGLVDNALGDNALSDNALASNHFQGNQTRGSGPTDADMAGMALNGMRLDSTTLKTVPGPVWAKDTDPPEPD